VHLINGIMAIHRHDNGGSAWQQRLGTVGETALEYYGGTAARWSEY
jgi:hypothetical protein